MNNNADDEIQVMIKRTLTNGGNMTLDAIVELVITLKAESIGRSDDYETGQDDAYNAVLNKIKLFKEILNK